MGLGDDHSGIVDLPAEAPLGEAYVRWAGLDDPIIEISVTPNRGDALSVHGVARDLAAAGLGRLKPLPEPAIKPAYPRRWFGKSLIRAPAITCWAAPFVA
jgi:phenylalanyl-tRNA synthetase beta chain